MMSDVFISYAEEDRQRAEIFVKLFQGLGWKVFWDQNIPIGSPWRDTIEEELTNARCVIVLWSENSIKSSWVKGEAEDAMQRRILVPILIDKVSIPVTFRTLQSADLSDWVRTREAQEFHKLFSAIAVHIGSPPKQLGLALAAGASLSRAGPPEGDRPDGSVSE